jgi:hypothetical protein
MRPNSSLNLEALILENAPSEPYEVGVGVQVHQIEFVDQKAENFGIVGTLRMEWKDPALAFDPNDLGRAYQVFTPEAFRAFANENGIFFPGFVIQNQQKRRFKQQAGYLFFQNGKAYYFEQFSAVLQAPDFDFTKFPFDTQKFFVHVAAARPDSFVKFVPIKDFSKLGDSLGEEEWLLTDTWVEISTQDGFSRLPHSLFSFGFKGHRHLDYYIVRIFTPLGIFILVAWATFFLEEYRRRIDFAAANLLIFVAFNFTISGDLPRLGYMTFLDFILMAMFIITAMIIILNVGLRRLKIIGQEPLAQRIDKYVLKWIYPLAYALVISYAIYRFLLDEPTVMGS